jgi:molybdopterin-guanine dinucleotide biosynthesis protein A
MKKAPAFAAVVLAGGQSRRMGTDKAFLAHPESEQPCWQRQHSLLQTLGPSTLWISANAEQEFPGTDIVRDRYQSMGPLGGLLAGLENARESLLLVLAVDMIAMTGEPLQTLIDHCQEDCGAIYRDVSGFYQPTAAVYPKQALESVRSFQQSGQRRLQDLVQVLVDAKGLKVLNVLPNQSSAFANFNSPQDFVHV